MFILLCLTIATICIIKVCRDDRKNRPEHYAVKRAARREARVKAIMPWQSERSRANIAGMRATTDCLDDEAIYAATVHMLGSLSGYVSSSVWDRCLALIPVPCDVIIVAGGKPRRCTLDAGHDGAHRL